MARSRRRLAATRRPPSSWPSATARSTRGGATLASPPSWPGTSGWPGPWTARPCRLGQRREVARAAARRAVSSPQALNLAPAPGRSAAASRSCPAVSAEYDALVRESRGIVAATVTTPAPALREGAGGRQGPTWKSSPARESSSQPDGSGAPRRALTVRIGDRLIDASVSGRLERLRGQLVQGTS